MELVYFVYEFPPYTVGGLGTYSDYMTRELVKLGHDVTVFTLHTDDAPTRDVYRGVEVHRPIIKDMDISQLLPMFIPDEIHKWAPSVRNTLERSSSIMFSQQVSS